MVFLGIRGRSFRGFIRSAAAPLGFLFLSACASGTHEDTGPIFYPSLPELPRLQYLTTINTAEDIGGDGSGSALFGAKENVPGFVRPFGVSHEKGMIYVADPGQAAIVTVDLAARKFDITQETTGGPYRSPMEIFVAADGYKYIADSDREQIIVLDETGKFSRTYGRQGQFRPLSVAVEGERVYVCDVQDNEIEVLDRQTGEAVSKVGSRGTENGQFQWPTRVTLGSAGGLFVTDFLNFRIQQFDHDGKFVKAIGELGTFPGATPRPKGIAVDRDGYLYAIDGAFELVQVFDTRTAEVLMGFGKFGPKPGSSWLPAGVDLDYDNLDYFAKYVDKNFRAKYLVYVVNQAGFQKLNVYAFGDWIGPPPKGATEPAESGS